MKRILPVFLLLLLLLTGCGETIKCIIRGRLPADLPGRGQRDDGHSGCHHHPGCEQEQDEDMTATFPGAVLLPVGTH